MIKRLKLFVKSFIPQNNYTSSSGEKLDNHVVIITGASGNIGKALAETLYKEGANLTLVSRSSKPKNNWDSGRVLLLDADCSNEKGTHFIIDETIKRYGRVDTVVNCAGQFLNKSFDKISAKDYESVMDGNLKTTVLMAKAVVPIFKKERAGLIVNIGSKISHNTNVTPDRVLYAAAKYAVEGFSFALNKELKPYKIRVTCLMPGTVNTFISRNSRNYLSPYDISSLVLMLIKFKNIDFESILFKSVKQNI